MKNQNLKRYKNYVSWKDNKGNYNTECNRASLETDLSLTIPTNNMTKVLTGGANMEQLRIRKLTPKECLRLMGFTDKDYQALVDIGLSNSAIYHVAGDSIITTCLGSIFLMFKSDNGSHEQIINDYVENKIIERK